MQHCYVIHAHSVPPWANIYIHIYIYDLGIIQLSYIVLIVVLSLNSYIVS